MNTILSQSLSASLFLHAIVAGLIFLAAEPRGAARRIGSHAGEVVTIDYVRTSLAAPSRVEQTQAAPAARRSPVPAGPGARTRTEVATNETAERYLEQVYEILARAKEYPESALAAGESGIVEVGFRVQRDGSIRDIRILRPSRFPRLNAAALAMIRGIERFPPLPDGFPREDWAIELPLDFSLAH